MRVPQPEKRWLVWKNTSEHIHVHENLASAGTYILSCDCQVFDTKFQTCPHIRETIDKRLDGKSWIEHQHPNSVFVPIFDDFGVMVDMFHEEKASLWQVYLRTRGEANGEYLHSGSIGFVTMGEGRRDLRNLVVEWLHGQYQLVKPCQSPVHTRSPFSKEEKKRQLDATNPKVVKDVYHILSEGTCYQCHELDSISVPEI